MPTKRGAIGVDIGGSKTLCILVDDRYKIVHRIKFKTAPTKGAKRFTSILSKNITELYRLARKNRLRVAGVGFACAGTMDRKNVVVENSYNIPWMRNYRLGSLVKKLTGLPSAIGNDVHLGLLAEHRLGAARKKQDVLGVFFGTGVGGAVIIDGKLYRGASGTAGNVGSLFTRADSDPALARDHGILDRLASKAAIAGAALGLALKQQAPALFSLTGSDLTRVTWGALAKSIAVADKAIEELLRSRMHTVGITLAGLTNFLAPELLLLGGGLIEEMPALVQDEIEAGIRKFLDPETDATLKVKVAKFQNAAGAIGAANLAFESFKEKKT